MLIGAGVGLAIVIVLIIVFSTGGGSKGATTALGVVSTAGASTSASAGASGSPAATVSASPSSAGAATSTAGSGGGASASASAVGAGSGATATSPGMSFPTALTTVPATAGQAVQEIQSAVSQAQGELSNTEQGQLSQIIGTLNQEIGSEQSISTGIAQLWALLHSGELPASLNTYLTQLATYLSASQGS